MLTREDAIEQYIILRLRTEDINRLDYLLNALFDGRVTPSPDSLFSAKDLKDTVRTSLLGWFASLTDKDGRAVYAFNSLFVLFPQRSSEIARTQISMGAVHEELQEFRNNVAFHARANVAAHIAARMKIRDEITNMEMVSAIHDFQALMKRLREEELTTIPELPESLRKLGINLHPAFANIAAVPQVAPVIAVQATVGQE